MFKSILYSKKAVTITLSFLFLVLMVGLHMDAVSDFQFSDGIPMLIRLERFYSGEFDISNYVFLKHGNSIHAIIYLLAWVNDVFFSGTADLLKGCLFFAMVSTALLTNWIMYRRTLSTFENLIVFIIADIIVAGTYNFDLYLPFQNCLTFARFFYVLLMWKMATCLSEGKGKHWVLWLVLSCLAALMHGMGMMFAISFFYLHVATKQSIKRCTLALLPFGVYTCVQLYFSGNYGEVSSVSRWLVPYFSELLLSILSFYGGFCHILFGWSKDVCMGIGIFLFTTTFITLLYFLIVPYVKIKWLPQIPLKNRKALFALGLLAISFLCSIGSAAFVVARKNNSSYDSVMNVMGCGRYLCYGIVPYVIMLYFSMRAIKSQVFRRTIFFAHLLLLLILICRNDEATARSSIAVNAHLDREATALLSGLNLDTKELEKGYGKWAPTPFYARYIPETYQRLQKSNRYIWHNQPALGAKVLNPTTRGMIQAMDVSLTETSDPRYLFIQFYLPTVTDKRYTPLADEKYAVVGFAYSVPHRYFTLKKGKLHFQRMYAYEGYVKKQTGRNYYALPRDDTSYSPVPPVVNSRWLPISVRFADKNLPIETSGLSFAESWGRWSDGDVVTLRLDVPQNKPLKFTVLNPRVLLYPDNPKVVGTIYANSVKVGTWVFQYKKPFPKTEFVVPVNVLKMKKPLDIEIKIDGAKAPIDLGVNKDKRRLGLGFRTLSITPAL